MSDSQETLRNAVALMKFKTGTSNASLAQIVGVSTAAFSARMRGATEWKVSDVDKLAEHWHIQPFDLLMGPDRASEAYDLANGYTSGNSNTAGQSAYLTAH